MPEKRLEEMIAITTRSMAAKQYTFTGDVLVILFGAGFWWERRRRERFKMQRRERKMNVRKLRREGHLIRDGKRGISISSPETIHGLETSTD